MIHCPKCNSRRVQTSEHAIRSYRCLSCGWIEIGEIKPCLQAFPPRKYLRLRSVWLNVVFPVVILAGGYFIYAEGITPAKYFALQDVVSLFSEKSAAVREIKLKSVTTESPVILEPPTEAAQILPEVSSLDAVSASLRQPEKKYVVANSKSKRYHLPGMKYYDKIPKDRRVVFTSEEAARQVGYHKSSR